MKKFPLLVLAVLVTFIASCNKESYYHTMSIAYPSGVGIVYADQPMDSVLFYVTDNFQITPNVDWVTVPDSMKSGKIENYYRNVWLVPAPLLFEANTTGKPRTATVSVHCYGDDDWDQTANALYYQFAWPEIQKPAPAYSYYDGTVTGADFEAKDSATQVADTLKFHVYDTWTLTDGKFVHPVITTGVKGQYTVAVTVEPNATTLERKDSLVLKVRGVETAIKFIQAGRKE